MANDVYQLTILGTSGGEFYETVQNFQSQVASSTTPMTSAENMIAGWQAHLESDYLDCLPDSVFISGYKCKRINNGGGPTVMTPITPVPGTRPNPTTVACIGPCIVSLYPHAGKWSAGKWFLPGVSTDDVMNNALDPALVGVVNNFISSLSGAIAGGTDTFNFVVWSRKFTLPFVPSEVEVSLKIGVQRRRLRPVM
jgi:hypothetical protein